MRTLAGLSVVLACLNDEENIERAVRSSADAADQASDEYEVIVVDDGSRDGSLPVASGFARRDPHVRVLVHAGTRGYGAAVRTGIGAARMPWILLTDAGLPVDPHELENFLPLTADADLVVGRRTPRGARSPAASGRAPAICSCIASSARPCTTPTAPSSWSGASWSAGSRSAPTGRRSGPSSSCARWWPAPACARWMSTSS